MLFYELNKKVVGYYDFDWRWFETREQRTFGLIFVEVFFGGIGTFSLFGFIYTLKYKVSITQKTIIIKTLFKKIELNISDIEKYIYERYNKKIILYVFKLIVTNKKKILITRYKDEFIEILTQNNIDRVFD